jgi:hypothetical protein
MLDWTGIKIKSIKACFHVKVVRHSKIRLSYCGHIIHACNQSDCTRLPCCPFYWRCVPHVTAYAQLAWLLLCSLRVCLYTACVSVTAYIQLVWLPLCTVLGCLAIHSTGDTFWLASRQYLNHAFTWVALVTKAIPKSRFYMSCPSNQGDTLIALVTLVALEANYKNPHNCGDAFSFFFYNLAHAFTQPLNLSSHSRVSPSLSLVKRPTAQAAWCVLGGSFRDSEVCRVTRPLIKEIMDYVIPLKP